MGGLTVLATWHFGLQVGSKDQIDPTAKLSMETAKTSIAICAKRLHRVLSPSSGALFHWLSFVANRGYVFVFIVRP